MKDEIIMIMVLSAICFGLYHFIKHFVCSAKGKFIHNWIWKDQSGYRSTTECRYCGKKGPDVSPGNWTSG